MLAAVLILLIPPSPALANPPTPTSTPVPPIYNQIGGPLVEQFRITTAEIWAAGGTVQDVMLGETDAMVLTRTAMGEAPQSFDDRFYIMWLIRLRAELGYKNASRRGWDPPDDRWGDPTSIKREALCLDGCQFAPVEATFGIYFPANMRGGNIKAMIYPGAETLPAFLLTWQAAQAIAAAPMTDFPERLRGYDGFRSPTVDWIGTHYYSGGLPSVRFFRNGNIWRDGSPIDNAYWLAPPPVTVTPSGWQKEPTFGLSDARLPAPALTPTPAARPIPQPPTGRGRRLEAIVVHSDYPTNERSSVMEQLPQLVIAGVPLILIVLAVVEEIKAYGVEGKILRVLSVLVGLALAIAVSIAQSGVPADVGGWITLFFVGLVYGLSASGAYDFVNARLPAVQ